MDESINVDREGEADGAQLSPRIVMRVVTPGKPKFQLKRGEPGISVFDFDAVAPPLDEAEVLHYLRLGSQAVYRTVAEIEARGMQLVATPGDPRFPQRLQLAHAEILPAQV
jgi:hypothetical protein